MEGVHNGLCTLSFTGEHWWRSSRSIAWTISCSLNREKLTCYHGVNLPAYQPATILEEFSHSYLRLFQLGNVRANVKAFCKKILCNNHSNRRAQWYSTPITCELSLLCPLLTEQYPHSHHASITYIICEVLRRFIRHERNINSESTTKKLNTFLLP